MGKNQERLVIPAGSMINRGPHEDDDYLLARKDLIAEVIERLPGAVKVIIPQLTAELTGKYIAENLPEQHQIFYIHQPD
ncbi:MAG TPA: hypothetical protein PLX28_03455 [Candidatus Woesebacteria bacterium]|jgi:hypothetical protein|nr:hypothetical protein [Candidatus Woesebacteria bacterium]HOP38933.1 hypothetical protein [Candidatus Woesebacteria bacterium]HPA62228.1 hypothetical protein [Candidatus Woesebacteria bacterium]HQO51803.1 hypothetical protein [Candidatus Woesebacteria bacterium]HUM57522.1 hypothetical protein [Candidatus Woesebacteria bacterium]